MCADDSVLTPTDIAGGQSEFMFSTATLYKYMMFPLMKWVVFVFDHSVQIHYIIEHWLYCNIYCVNLCNSYN
jgi:hypothetical protein